MYLSIGGRYCSMTIVDRGNALVLDLIKASTATADGTVSVVSFDKEKGMGYTIYTRSFAGLSLGRFPNPLERYCLCAQ